MPNIQSNPIPSNTFPAALARHRGFLNVIRPVPRGPARDAVLQIELLLRHEMLGMARVELAKGDASTKTGGAHESL